MQDSVANRGNNNMVNRMDARSKWDYQGSLGSRKGKLEHKAPRERWETLHKSPKLQLSCFAFGHALGREGY